MKTKIVWLVRHGETDWNQAKRFIGQKDPWLNQNGKKQAARIGNIFLKKRVFFEKVFSSPLRRSFQTAKIISRAVGFPPKRIIVIARLKEQSFGRWGGKTRKETEPTWGLLAERWHQNPFAVVPPGGESFSDLNNRLEPFARMIQESSIESCLVVSHANVLNALIGLLLKKTVVSRFSGHGMVCRIVLKKGKAQAGFFSVK